MICPICGAPCERHAVDIGVGTQYGPWFCLECAWAEASDDPGLIVNDDGDL